MGQTEENNAENFDLMLWNHSFEKFQDWQRLDFLGSKCGCETLVDFFINCGPLVQKVLNSGSVDPTSRQIRLASFIFFACHLWSSKPIVDLEKISEEGGFDALLVHKIENI